MSTTTPSTTKSSTTEPSTIEITTGPSTTTLELMFDEVRRLTGPNLLWDNPGAIVDVLGKDIHHPALPQAWARWSRLLLDELGWQQCESISRVFSGGASLAISAPVDALYTACDLAELIWGCCYAELCGQPMPNGQLELNQIRSSLEQERKPRLLALLAQAKQSSCLALHDDDEFSLGAGASAQTWPLNELPDPAELDWASFKAIPIAYVTGTNGKSTSVRLAAEIALAANIEAGLTSTDFIRVGNTILGEGDFSGPGGARTLLRDQRTEMAFLEVARGGILRRGLPVDRVEAALITNVASDHLGQYGIDTVDELAQVKFVVGKALSDSGVLVVNADNELVVNETKRFCAERSVKLCWFSKNAENPLIVEQLSQGGRAVYVRNSEVIYSDAGNATKVLALSDIPITFGGHAQHNVENVLGVVGLCAALGLPLTAMQLGLQRFASDPQDNPGRGNLYQVDGVQVIVDFAHNQHSMQAVVNLAKNMPAGKRIVMFGHAGDRSDQDIFDVTDEVLKMQPDHYVLCEYAHYLRGREMGAIPALVAGHLNKLGVDAANVDIANDPLLGVKLALAKAQAGDIVLLFVLDQRDAVHQFLSKQ